MRARPQTQSWLSKTARLAADGAPPTITAAVTQRIARRRGIPVSIRRRVASSNIAISDDSAAQNRARKNSGRNSPPPGIRSKSWGIQMKVRPVFPLAITPSASFSERIANAVGTMAIPASSEAVLLPIPMAVEFSTTSSSRFTYTA